MLNKHLKQIVSMLVVAVALALLQYQVMAGALAVPQFRAGGGGLSLGPLAERPALQQTAAQLPVAVADSPDGIWAVPTSEAVVAAGAARANLAGPYSLVRLNKFALDQELARAPMEDTPGVVEQVVITLPLPDGSYGRFRIEESPLLAPELAAVSPDIRTYRGSGIDDPTATTRFGWTSAGGFHAIVLAAGGSTYIDAAVSGDVTNYVSVNKAALPRPAFIEAQLPQADILAGPPGASTIPLNNGTQKRTYRLSLAGTSEYVAAAPAGPGGAPAAGTREAARDAMAATMNRVRAIYERDLAVSFTVSHATVGPPADPLGLLYTNAATDPYPNDSGNGDYNANQTNMDNATVVGTANYDIGHVFGTGGGGLAGLGVVCSAGNKARGVTGLGNPFVGTPFDIDYVAHEMGHQFGANHTFNGTTGAGTCNGNGVAASAYEPGSASTIMGYAGICGAENLQSNSNDYFHIRSLDEITTYLAGGGAACGTTAATGNTVPSVTAGSNHTIPQKTPFKLETSSASDANGDALTYAWEEYDLGGTTSTVAGIHTDSGQPIFRSYGPQTGNSRTFPSLPFILKNKNIPPQTYSGAHPSEVVSAPASACSGTCATGEVLPSTNRAMTFQVTVRDNRASGGGIRSSSRVLTVTTAAGPFQVTDPNAADVKWQATTTENVKWDVASTTGGGVNTANVKISLSTDSGKTFPTVLEASTPNDGSEDVDVPNTLTKTARIKVEAVGNVFFDISDEDFEIEPRKITLALVVDDTGSMGEEIASVRTSLSNTITRLEAEAATTKKPFPTVAILAFADDVRTKVISDVPATLQASVATLFASGGGDCPEHSNDALIAAGNLLSNEGEAILFTDADSHPTGPSRGDVLAVFRPKSIRLSVLLSGSCSGGGLRGPVPTADNLLGLGYSDNRDPSGVRAVSGSDDGETADTLGNENAVRTYSELAAETGGLLTAIPEVNSFGTVGADGKTKYINVATNISVSAVYPAVAVLTPSAIPQGVAMRVELVGSNTNFQNSSTVTISGSGVTVLGKTALSPTRLQVDIAVSGSAATGFRDVTVTTSLGAGIVETALGGGSLQITTPPTTAQIVGITPTEVGQTKSALITITGINTAFASGVSTVNMGSGVTINSVVVASPTALHANITVSATATIGYRNVSVTTGSQFAGESGVGPLLITAPPPVFPRVTSATPSSAKRGRQTAITIVGTDTNFVAGASTLTFSGADITVNSVTVNSPTSLLAILTIGPNATLGFRDLTVTTGTEVAVLLGGFNVTDPAAFPAALVFGATKNGPAGALVAITPPQEVTVSYSGIASSAAWTATIDQPWATVFLGSGTGAGRFIVGITDPTNSVGAQTDLRATITISVPSAGITETVAVRLLVQQSTATSGLPVGQVDTPAQNATGVVGAMSMTGWALDDTGIEKVEIFRQCVPFEAVLVPSPCQIVNGVSVVFVGNAIFISGARPDVEIAYGALPANNRAGWGFLVLTNMLPHIANGTPAGGEGVFTFYALAVDREGKRTFLGRSTADTTPTTVTVSNDTIAKPFGAIDTPGQGSTADGASYSNFGWVLTPDPGTGVLMPVDGSTIQVYVDGAAVGTATYNLCRGSVGPTPPAGVLCDDDVSALFRGAGTRFRNLDAGRGPIGLRSLNTTTLTNGLHTISWGVVDSAGRAEGVGSRFFSVLNASSTDTTAASDAWAAAAAATGSLAVAPLDQGKSMAAAALLGRTGFDLTTALAPIATDASGVGLARIPELGRLELRVPGVVRGVLLGNGESRALPVGLAIDRTTGTVTWAPGPGYLGTYRLAFERDTDRVLVDVTVGSATTADAPIRMNIDMPASGSTADGWVTTAGWALDSHSWTGSGIGAVHVWAFRRGVADDPNPLFLGTATLGLPRPDVAAAHGAAFGESGFSLTAQLPPGEYEIVTYAWSVRTARFEDARTVRVTVR